MSTANATATARTERAIAAPVPLVWDMLTVLHGWPWSTGADRRRIESVHPEQSISWKARRHGRTTLHRWELTPREELTIVRAQTSHTGLLARLLRGRYERALARRTSWELARLSFESERRARARAREVVR